jgi:uncharacterized membrane protein
MAELFLLGLLLSLPIIVIFAVIFGFSMPALHSNQEIFELPYPAAKIWNLIANIQSYPQWMENVLETKCEDELAQVWTQESEVIPVRFQVKNIEVEKRFELEIVPGNIPGKNIQVDGNLVIELESLGESLTRVNIHHQGSIHNPMLRTFLFYFHKRDDPSKVIRRSLERIELK